jgi:small subunit ribosomal protein S4
MKIGPKFKIAKRLGAPIFEKTQTQKFALSEARGGRRTTRRPGQMSDYKRQLNEKQKMRYSYGITEKQLRKYVDEAVSKSQQPMNHLVMKLERRLDNVAYRLGLAKTRQMARQMAAHGHLTVNGKKFTIPSHQVKVGDVIAVREGSRNSGLFTDLADSHQAAGVPGWLKFDSKKLTGEVVGLPTYEPSETLFDPEQVLQYYSR